MINSITDSSLKKCTGKDWASWIKILDLAGARLWTHQEIVKFLRTKHKQSLWWQQMITNGFEVHIGRRLPGQSLKGTYSITATKTVAADALKVWRWCTSQEGLQVWLKPLSPVRIRAGESFEVEGGVFGEIRTLKTPHRIRLSWQEIDWDWKTTVQFLVYKRKSNSMIVIQHDGLRSAKQKIDAGRYWRKIIAELKTQFT